MRRDRRRLGRRPASSILQDDLLPFGDRRLAALERRRPPAIAADGLLGRRRWRVNMSSIVSPWRTSTSRSDALAAGVWRRLRDVGDVFRHHPHFDRGERRVGARRAGRRVGERARAGRCRPGWCASAAFAAAKRQRRSPGAAGVLDRFDDLRLRLGERQFAGHRGGVGARQIALRERDFGVVLRRAGVGRRVRLLGRAAGQLQADRTAARRRRSRSASGSASVDSMREGPRLDDFLVADLDRRRRLEGLLGGDDVDRPHQPVALARIDPFAARLRGGGATAISGASAKLDWRSSPR